MKRFSLSLLILLALVVGAAGAAQAAVGDPCDADGNAGTIQASGLCVPNNASTGVSCDADGNPGTLNAAGLCVPNGAVAASPTDPATAKTPSTYKGDTSPSSPYNFIMIKIMELFAWLLGVAALTLNYAAYYTVVTMGNYVNHLSAIGVTWRILRDIGNIMLIFGFLAVGITTILNVDWYGGGKKMLPMMLVAAVFLNFSLFISEAIIDTGNLFATQFYKQIVGGTLPTQSASGLLTTASGATLTTANEGISNAIMSKLGLPTIYGNGVANSQIFQGGNPWLIGFMGIILFIVTAFVMFSLAFVLIARFVALVFLIIVAPIGFAGLAIPGFAARAKDYWTTLFHQTITAPILLLMLYIALAVITDVQFLTGFGLNSANTVSGGWWTGFVNNANLPGFAGILLSFLVAMGLLLAVTVYAKRWSAFGGDWATKTAGKLTFGVTAWGVNRTVGRGAYFASRGLRQSATFNKINAMTGRALSGTLDRVATGSFDLRASGALKNVPFASTIALGEAQKGGFTEARKQNIKAHEEEAKRIEEAHKEAFKGGTEEDKKKAKEAKATYDRAVSGRDVTRKEHEAAIQEVKDRQAELKRIEEEKIMTPDRDARLAAARSALDASTKKQTDLKDALGKLDDIVKNLGEAEKNAKAAAETRMKKDIEASKIAYAEGIDHPFNPITFVAYGPDTAAAARKIKSSLKEKPTKDKLVDLMKNLAKEEEKPPEEAPKPETKPEAEKQ
jgi:hypothetical protein